MNPFVRMFLRRMSFGQWLVFIGGFTLALGVLLLLVKLVVALSYLGPIIILAGLAVLVVGLLLTRSRRRRRDIEDDMPYL